MTRVLGFGEILLRLSPPRHGLLSQARTFEMWIGGAEANVVTALAWLGRDAALASAIPDNDLGRRARAELRGHGVDVAGLRDAPGRMGQYFVYTMLSHS